MYDLIPSPLGFFNTGITVSGSSMFFPFYFYGTGIVNINHTHGSAEHKYPCQHQGIDRLVMIKVFYGRTADDAVNNLGNGDEEIENSHIDSHFTWRDGAGKDHVRHGQYAGPGHTHADH